MIPKPRIAYFTNTSIVFEDGTSLSDVDSVILGTGYEFRIPFLSPPPQMDAIWAHCPSMVCARLLRTAV